MFGVKPFNYLGIAGAAIVLVSESALAQSAQITGVRLNKTDILLEVILETNGRPKFVTRTEGKILQVDAIDASLNLPGEREFRAENPFEGIESVRVTAEAGNIVRVTITGTNSAPAISATISERGLVVSAIPVVGFPEPTTQTEETPPAPDIEIVSTREQDIPGDYYVPNSTTATRTDTALRDIPQSVQIIPEKVIQDQQASTLQEVVTNTSGVIFSGNNDGRGIDIAIRGFNRAAILRDGFRVYNRAAQGLPEIANLERVEILKGPSSVLFGESEPGGLINLVSKQPLSEPFYNLQLQLGNRNFVRLPVDLSGPLTEDANLNYRLNTLYRYEDSFRNFNNSYERFFVAPTLASQIAKNTDLSFNLEYTKDTGPVDFGTAIINGKPADIPRERITNNPDDRGETEFINTGYNFEHRFSENWKIRNAFRYISNTFNSGNDDETVAVPILIKDDIVPAPLFLTKVPTGTLIRTFTDQEREEDSFTLYTNVEGNLATGKIKHNLLFGIDLNHTETKLSTRFDPGRVNPITGVFEPNLANLSSINIFAPDYDAFPAPDVRTINFFNNDDVTNNRLGIYLQDRLDLLDNLILLAGLRYDTFNETIKDNLTNTEDSQNSDAFSPRIGIVYQPIEAISLYSSYSQSFNPKPFLYNRTADGGLLKPERGEGFEVGIKGEIVPNRLATTVAYFNITRENVATIDRFNPFVAVVIGEQQNQGIEFDLSGEILPGWNIIASYAYIDAKVTKDDDPKIVGSRFPNIPENSAGLWTTYEIQKGDFKGFGLGIGFNFVGERKGGLPNSFEVDSYFLTNAALFYNRENWQLRLNFNNLFDVNFIEAVDTSPVRRVYPGTPFTVRGLFSVKF